MVEVSSNVVLEDDGSSCGYRVMATTVSKKVSEGEMVVVSQNCCKPLFKVSAWMTSLITQSGITAALCQHCEQKEIITIELVSKTNLLHLIERFSSLQSTAKRYNLTLKERQKINFLINIFGILVIYWRNCIKMWLIFMHTRTPTQTDLTETFLPFLGYFITGLHSLH